MEDVNYLRSLGSIRNSCHKIYEIGLKDELSHFKIQLENMPKAMELVETTMKLHYPNGVNSVPFHARWRHFEPGNPDRVKSMCASWGEVDKMEKCRRLLDLVVVSVLLDAGAGNQWKYKEQNTDCIYTRSEGLGIASFHMFCSGAFSSVKDQKYRADANGLINLPRDSIQKGFQVTEENPLVGCQGRTELLQRLGHCLEKNATYFGAADGGNRPGNIVDYLVKHANKDMSVSIHVLWKLVMEGFQDMWPTGRTSIQGANMGDVWPHSKLPQTSDATAYVSFHKLSQWLTYSMMEPLTEFGLHITDLDAMTGLPEYRNGGLFVDLGVLVAKEESTLVDSFEPSSEVIVEWRALTVALLDVMYDEWKKKYNLTSEEFPLVKLLEAGSWKAGRVIAQQLRQGPPPITIISDGTVF